MVSAHQECLEMDQPAEVWCAIHVRSTIGQTITDIDDCHPSPCYEGVTCTDMSAPRRGYSCASCPPPLIGDGITCTQPSYIPCPATVSCYPGAQCLLLPGDKVLCGQCPPGLHGDGVVCTQDCSSSDNCSSPPTTQIDTTTPGTGECKKPCRYELFVGINT